MDTPLSYLMVETLMRMTYSSYLRNQSKSTIYSLFYSLVYSVVGSFQFNYLSQHTFRRIVLRHGTDDVEGFRNVAVSLKNYFCLK